MRKMLAEIELIFSSATSLLALWKNQLHPQPNQFLFRSQKVDDYRVECGGRFFRHPVTAAGQDFGFHVRRIPVQLLSLLFAHAALASDRKHRHSRSGRSERLVPPRSFIKGAVVSETAVR